MNPPARAPDSPGTRFKIALGTIALAFAWWIIDLNAASTLLVTPIDSTLYWSVWLTWCRDRRLGLRDCVQAADFAAADGTEQAGSQHDPGRLRGRVVVRRAHRRTGDVARRERLSVLEQQGADRRDGVSHPIGPAPRKRIASVDRLGRSARCLADIQARLRDDERFGRDASTLAILPSPAPSGGRPGSPDLATIPSPSELYGDNDHSVP